MLLAGSVTSIAMFLKHYELTVMLKVLLAVLIVFYIVGDTFRYLYEKFRPIEEDEKDDDESGDDQKEIIADDDVEEEYRPSNEEEEIGEDEELEDDDEDDFKEDDSNVEATGDAFDDEAQEEEYMDSYES